MRYALTVLLSFFLLACSSNPSFLDVSLKDADRLDLDKRIIERDLTIDHQPALPVPSKYLEPVQQNEDYFKKASLNIKSEPRLENVETPIDHNVYELKRYFINFYNESSVPANEEQIKEIAGFISDSDQAFLIGHSHGPSHIGTEKLAKARAKAVRDSLLGEGISPKQLSLMANWSPKRLAYTPVKGVEILVKKATL